MLTPEQVIPFLLHDDVIVRQQALDYFSACSNPGPFTADHVWAVVDRFGPPDEDTIGPIGALEKAPQTESSLRRVIEKLGDKPSNQERYACLRVIRMLHYPTVLAYQKELMECPGLSSDVRRYLELMVSVADEPTDALWERLMRQGQELGPHWPSGMERSEIHALVEALGQRGEQSGALALASLQELGKGGDWREAMAVEVLGMARYEPAVGALVRRYLVDEDVLRETVSTSLGRIGTVAVVDEIAKFIPGKEWHVRLYADDALRWIKLPESERALMELLDQEKDRELRGQLMMNLCDLGSLAALDACREHIAADPDDPEVLGLTEAMIATAIMNGNALPEESAWRERLASVAARRAKQTPLERLVEAIADLKKRGLVRKDWDGLDAPEASMAERMFRGPEREQPFRRPEAKVGRNDPCPCGSGKKYKKCCLKASEGAGV